MGAAVAPVHDFATLSLRFIVLLRHLAATLSFTAWRHRLAFLGDAAATGTGAGESPGRPPAAGFSMAPEYDPLMADEHPKDRTLLRIVPVRDDA